MRFVFSILSLMIFFGACSKKTVYTTINSSSALSKYVSTVAYENPEARPCTHPLNYAPDADHYDHYDERIIKVNVHFTCSEDGKVGFGKEQGRRYMTDLINNANDRLKENKKMKLPVGNNTPALQPLYRYKVTPISDDPDDDGFYWHYDDELYYFVNKGKNRNNYSKAVIDKYENGGDSILHLFVMPHHPDSVISKTYRPSKTGIALRSSLKMAGLYERSERSWECATLLNHEVGHILGLAHSWTKSDGCDDTPQHPNCWQDSGCDGPASNNMMDYNNSQMAITPCQLGKMHRNLSRLNSKVRKFLVPTWCELDLSRDIIIDETLHWNGERDIGHNIVIKKGGALHVHCRVAMPKASSITVEPGGTLVLENCRLHNDCGDQWEGINLISEGRDKANLISIGEVSIENTTKDK